MSLFNRSKAFWIIKPNDTKAEKKAIEKTGKITDQELLKEIYSTASTKGIRNAALLRIEDPEYLYDVFINTNENALSLINDPSVLCRIADDPEIPMDLRRTAAYRCRCGQLYREIETRAAMDRVCLFNGEGWWDSFKSEILPILARINSEEALREIAHQAKSRAVAEYAVQRINDSQTLSEIAKDIHAAQKYYKETCGLFEEMSLSSIYKPLGGARVLALTKLKELNAALFDDTVKSIVLNRNDTPCFRGHLLANHASQDVLASVAAADESECGLQIEIPYEQEQYGEYKTETCMLSVNLKAEAEKRIL